LASTGTAILAVEDAILHNSPDAAYDSDPAQARLMADFGRVAPAMPKDGQKASEALTNVTCRDLGGRRPAPSGGQQSEACQDKGVRFRHCERGHVEDSYAVDRQNGKSVKLLCE
jgi:hypothetical protein